MSRTNTRARNSKGRFVAEKPIDVRSPAMIPALEGMIRRGPTTFILIYADWCGHCQSYKPMWEKLTRTPGRVANMAAVQETVFPSVPSISRAKIQGYPSVIKVGPNGTIESYNVRGETTNAIDSAKMRDMESMRAEIKTRTPSTPPTPSTPSTPNTSVDAVNEETDIYTPVSSEPGFMRGTYNTETPGSLLTTEDHNNNTPMSGGGLSIAAAFASAVQSVGPAALLLAAHSLLPKRRGTYKSPKRSNRRGGTRRQRR